MTDWRRQTVKPRHEPPGVLARVQRNAISINASIATALTSSTERLLADILVEFPRFRLISKRDSKFARVIDWCLRLITLGRQNRFLTEYHTVIGETLYLAPSWSVMDDRARYVLLCHERVHLRQRRRYGTVPMALLYLIPILPVGLAFGRAWLEWEAYRETLRATAEMYGIEVAAHPGLRSSILRRFIGPDYGWMWPFPKTVGKWYDCWVDELRGQPAIWSVHDGNE